MPDNNEKEYAFIKDGVVVNTAIFDNPSEELLNIFIQEYNLDNIVLATDKTQVGGEYDGIKFWRTKPFPSWMKNEEINEWAPPANYPMDGQKYIWDESIEGWKKTDE